MVHLRDPAALRDHLADWDALAEAACEPNPFHESWFLLPALEAFAAGEALHFALVYRDTGCGSPELCAFFPLERARRYRGLPLAHLRLWRPVHAYLGTPLVRRGRVREALEALHDWLRADAAGAPVMEWGWITTEGSFFHALADVITRRDLVTHLAQAYGRALLRPRASADAYLAEAFSAKALREYRRLERRLRETGNVEYAEFPGEGSAQEWVEAFLALEASGWKGRGRSALGSTPANRAFFTQAALGAAQRGRLAMIALRLEGRPIAMLCKLRAGDGAFAFKMAYDEAWARFSPGTLLEVEHLRRFHAQPDPRWMDSCAAPVHFMADRTWIDRRAIATLLTSTGRAPGELTVSLLPLARWIHRKLRRGGER